MKNCVFLYQKSVVEFLEFEISSYLAIEQEIQLAEDDVYELIQINKISFRMVEEMFKCLISKSLVKELFQETYFVVGTLDIRKLQGNLFQVVYNCQMLERVDIGQFFNDNLFSLQVKELLIAISSNFLEPLVKYKRYPGLIKSMIETLKGLEMNELQKHLMQVALMKINSLLIELDREVIPRDMREYPKSLIKRESNRSIIIRESNKSIIKRESNKSLTKRSESNKSIKQREIKKSLIKQVQQEILQFTLDIGRFMKLQLVYCEYWQDLIEHGNESIYLGSPCTMFHDKLEGQLVMTEKFIDQINETILKRLEMVMNWTSSPYLEEAIGLIFIQFLTVYTQWLHDILGDYTIRRWKHMLDQKSIT
jgi:hypothetical protein